MNGKRICPTCKGKKGKVEDTSSKDVTRNNWRNCKTCSGKGVV